MSLPKQADISKAFYLLLKPIVAGTAAQDRCYNHVPQEAKNLPTKPYVRFGITSLSDWGPKNELGYEGEIQVDVWSDMRGDQEAQEICDSIIAGCHNAPFTLTSGQAILMQHSGSMVFTDPDGITHHGVVRLRTISTES